MLNAVPIAGLEMQARAARQLEKTLQVASQSSLDGFGT
jgi:hypothetical protein